MDLIEQSLQQHLRQHPATLEGLWAVDENLPALSEIAPQAGLSLLTNRVDLQTRGEALGWTIRCSDFDFSPWADASLDRVYYRISKEKAVVHHIINQAWRVLKPGGELLLLGARQEGTKTYYDKARKLFGQGELDKLGKGDFAGILTRGTQATDDPSLRLDDRDYSQLRPIADDFISKPGLFGWDKLDQGSAFLADHLAELWPRLSTPQPRVLDLGCGYGYLAARAHEQGAASVVATDNNAAALLACQANFDRLGISGQVLADNCGASLDERFDLLLCNPPFHQGFALEGELTERFVSTAARLTAFDGVALFVVNQFIPLERKAQGLFAEIDTFADNGSFKLVRLARPKGDKPIRSRARRR
ncbi:MAG: 16S rRNA (guanine1207-N2)-methyltransferase [Motiliproteus sp.]|jgi:16S rRNA (guanine1207-N2)-methyltransferase